MNIGIVRMRVRDGLVPMRMDVRLAAVPFEVMLMPVMLVVRMRMGMGQRLVRMPVLVPLGEVQPDAAAHERRSDPERRPCGFAESSDGDSCANERRGREVSSGACRPQATQREDEQNK